LVEVFERIAGEHHEQVVFCHDVGSGLRAIIAIHSTALGPALGGTRFYPFDSEASALTDVLRLAKAMTYKAAAAGLDLGGGKAVLIGDPDRVRSEELLRAYGRFIETLGGRFITAEDVGTSGEDMDLIRLETRWVTGVSPAHGGSGDPSPATALGVLHGLRAVAMELWGQPSLAERTFAVQGVGKVGYHMVSHLVEAGGRVVVADVDPHRLERVVNEFGVEAVEADSIHSAPCDIFVPCALGAVLNDETIPQLRCAAVGGAANNQLLGPEHAKLLDEAGILYAPDFVINAGGLINVADELRGYQPQRALTRVKGIFATLGRVFRAAKQERITPVEAAERLAAERLRRIGRLKQIQVRPGSYHGSG
jgi:leucine dehydrogenase